MGKGRASQSRGFLCSGNKRSWEETREVQRGFERGRAGKGRRNGEVRPQVRERIRSRKKNWREGKKRGPPLEKEQQERESGKARVRQKNEEGGRKGGVVRQTEQKVGEGKLRERNGMCERAINEGKC